MITYPKILKVSATPSLIDTKPVTQVALIDVNNASIYSIENEFDLCVKGKNKRREPSKITNKKASPIRSIGLLFKLLIQFFFFIFLKNPAELNYFLQNL